MATYTSNTSGARTYQHRQTRHKIHLPPPPPPPPNQPHQRGYTGSIGPLLLPAQPVPRRSLCLAPQQLKTVCFWITCAQQPGGSQIMTSGGSRPWLHSWQLLLSAYGVARGASRTLGSHMMA